MAAVYVIPKEGMKVRNPEKGGHLPSEGDYVQDSTYWRRRIRDEDVTIGKPPKPASKTTSKQ